MSEQQFFVKLRDILVYLYPEEADARRVVNDAGMDSGNISFSTKAINNWTIILLQAQKENKTANLMAVTFKDYKENEKLSKSWHDYFVTVRDREVSLLPDVTSSRNDRWPFGLVGLAVVIFISIGILLQWFPFAFSKLVFPYATPAGNSSVFQPPSTPALSPTERKFVATFSVTPKATETPLSLVNGSVSPTIIQTLTRNVALAPTIAQSDILTTTISTTISSNEPTTSLGILEVKQSGECDKSYWGAYTKFEIINLKSEIIAEGQPEGESYIPAGTYDIVLHVTIGEPLIKRSVVIREKEKTIVDFSRDLSTLLLKQYSGLKYDLPYRVLQNGRWATQSSLDAGKVFCIVPGAYSINLFDNLYTFPGADKVNIDINVSTGENLVIESEIWTKYVGMLSTSVEAGNVKAHVTNIQTGEQANYYLGTHAWVPIGKYKILTEQEPYIGLEFEIEIKAGEETILPLPTGQLNVTRIEEKLSLITTLTPTSIINPTNTPKVAQMPTTDASISTTPSFDQILFYTDFKKDMKVDWIVAKNLVLADGRLASKGEFQANIGSMSWRNYRITLSRVSIIGHYSFFIRVQDKSNFIEIRCDGTPNQSGLDVCYWFKMVNGQEQLVPGDFFRTDAYDRSTIQIEIQGQTYRFIVDGEEVSKIIDLQHSFDSGGISILADDVLMLESIEVISLP